MTARPRSVLVAVALHDPGAGAAVETAGVLAAAFGAEVVVVGVAPLAQPAPAPDDLVVPLRSVPIADLQTAIDDHTQSQAAEAAQRLPRDVGRRTVLTWGEAGSAIVEAARTEAADLIVVAMRRGGALGHLLHDGADRYVLHHSDVPVLVVPVDSQEPDDRRTESPTRAAA